MKKFLVLFLTFALFLSLTACGENTDSTADPAGSTPAETAAPDTFSLSSDTDLNTLVQHYYTAKATADAELMRSTLAEGDSVNASIMLLEARVYEDFRDLKIYSCIGKYAGEYGVFATYGTKFYEIDTLLPGYNWFYAMRNSGGELRLMTMDELNKDGVTTEEYDHILQQVNKSPLVNQQLSSVNAAYEAARTGDARLHELLERLAAGTYEIPEETTTEEPTTEAPTEDPTAETTEESTGSSETLSPGTSNGIFITTNDVRFRSTPSTEENNLISYFQRGHYLELIAMEGDWAHVRDNQTSNGRGGTQECTGREGYVSKLFVETAMFAVINADNLRMRSTPSTTTNDNIVEDHGYVLYFQKGHLVRIIGEYEDWYHIADDQEKDASGGNQYASGKEGYIYKKFTDPYQP